MKLYSVLIFLLKIRSSEDIDVFNDTFQSGGSLYDEDVESRPSSPLQTFDSLNGDFDQFGLDPLRKETIRLIKKELLKNEYTKLHEDSDDDTVTFPQKIELNRSEYPWLKKLQKLLFLCKKKDLFSKELQTYLTQNMWLVELLLLINGNNKDDVSSQTITIENAQNPDLPALITSQNNTKDSRLSNAVEKLNISVDKSPNQLASPKNISSLMVFDEQQVSLGASTPSTKNGSNTLSSQKPNPNSSNIQIFFESSTTQPESGESEQQINKQDQGFGITKNSAESSEKHIENLLSNLLSQRPQTPTDKITQHSGTSITHNLIEERKINDLQSKLDKNPRPSKTNFQVQGGKAMGAGSIKAEKETSTYHKNGDLVKVKDKQKEKKVKKNKKKSKSKKRHKKKVDNQKSTKTKKKSKRHSKQKKKVAAVKKQDEHDTLNLKMGDDPNIYSLFENNHDLNTSKHFNGNTKNVSPNYFRYPPAMEKRFTLDDNMLNFEEDKRLKTFEPYNVFYKSNYSSPLDDTEAQKSTQNSYVKSQYDKTKVVDRRFLPDKNSFHEAKVQDYNIRPAGSTFYTNRSSAVDTEHKIVFNNGNQLQSDGSSQIIAFQNQLILKFTVRRKRL
jgi:hypothetical protein